MKKIDFVISDTHFSHRNILKYEPCRQGWIKDFSSMSEEQQVEAMNEALVCGWNSVVSPEHTVLHLGDFAMGKKELHAGFRKRLNGTFILVKGNHDSRPEKNFLDFSRGDELHEEMLEFVQDGNTYVCRHDPMHFLEHEAARAFKLLFGHLHGGNYPPEVPNFTRKKGVCLSVERLPCAPAPIPFSELVNLSF